MFLDCAGQPREPKFKEKKKIVKLCLAFVKLNSYKLMDLCVYFYFLIGPPFNYLKLA